MTAILLSACCSGSREYSDETFQPVEMSVTDTIGVDTGDEHYVFGDICAVDTDAHGNLFILDRVNCSISIFTADGEFEDSFGGIGSGPGEFLQPLDMAVLSNGDIAVTDWDAWGIFYFDSDHQYQRYLGPMPGGAPLAISRGADTSTTGLAVVFFNENDQPAGEYYLGSWADTPEESFRFLEGRAEVIPGESGRITINLPDVVFDSDSRGNLFAALTTDSTYCIWRFTAEGVDLGPIEREWAKVPNDADVISALREAAELNNESESEIPEFANAVAGVFSESDHRVWVRLGTSSIPFFHVYSPHGELIDSVICSEINDPLFELDFHFSGSEVYVWNTDPVDYPKVLVMENPLNR